MRTDPEIRREILTSLQMSRSSDGFFYLTVEDRSSGNTVVRVQLDDKALADLIATSYTKPCKTEFYPSPNIGKKMEMKEVLVKIEEAGKNLFDSYEPGQKARDMGVLLAHADKKNPGWTADSGEYNSKRVGHWKAKNGKQGRTYTLIMRRYV